MIKCVFELFTLHLCFTTLKQFSLSNAKYPAQEAQNFNYVTDLNMGRNNAFPFHVIVCFVNKFFISFFH